MRGALAGEYYQRIGGISRLFDAPRHLVHEIRTGRDQRDAHEIFLTVPRSTYARSAWVFLPGYASRRISM